MLVARISLTLSRHFSLSFIASGRSSGQHPVSSHSCWKYVRAGHPAFARPCVGVHKSTSLMSSSLLLQQYIYIYIYIYIYKGKYKMLIIAYLNETFFYLRNIDIISENWKRNNLYPYNVLKKKSIANGWFFVNTFRALITSRHIETECYER